MNRYFNLFLIITLVAALISCKPTIKLHKLAEKQLVTDLFNKQEKNLILFIKNDNCDVCKDFYSYVETNFDKLIAPKLPDNTEAYLITINDFKNPNMWLFHVLEGYSFPTTIYLNKSGAIQGIFKGGDLYSFDKFLNNLTHKTAINDPKIILDTAELNKKALIFQSFIDLKQNHTVKPETYKKIGKINQKSPNFISALVEAYYYKNNQKHPERIKFIKDFLLKNIPDSNSYFISQLDLVKAL